MNAGLLDLRSSADQSLAHYPEHFLFRRSQLEVLDYNPQSALILAQLCDLLMLFEKSCARSLNPATQPVAQCTVFILEIFLKMVEAERQSNSDFTANDF